MARVDGDERADGAKAGGRSLFRSTAVFGGLTMISRVLGLARDVVLASVFGSSAATDAFFVAFKIPNFMRRLFAEGAFSHAFVPVLSEYRTERDEPAVRALVGRASGVLLAILLVLTVAAVLGAEYLVMVFAPGFTDEPETFRMAADMLRITFPYLLFISLVACAQGVLNTYGRFGPPAFAPVLLNLVLIASAWWWTAWFDEPIRALAWGVFIAGIAQLLLMLPYLRAVGMLTLPRPSWRDSGVRRIMRLMLPAIFGSSVAQINLLVDTILASFLMTGSVSWLYYSDRLMEFPLGVFGVALGTVILPRLSGEHAARTPEQFSRTLDWALRWAMLIAVPATVGLVVMAGPILATLFQHGAFTPSDVRAASLSVIAYALGLHGFILVKVLSPGYFARQDMRTPVQCAAASMVCNMVLSTTAVWLLIGTGVGHAALALATGIAASINAALLFAGLRRRGIYTPGAGWWALLARIGAAAGIMGGVLWFAVADLPAWIDGTVPERAGALAGWLLLGMVLYAGVLLLLGLRPRTLREPAA
ncbi:murein biosynthesis integral membrane protein MurJ [Aquisalimonas lutea]|uniref:murein biosynthesis integral membrane protein MurJ n=1 Tax=Aquisalimonas lutea TaxID=1327750 RepID=UPI0025B60B43|nr:murein biosynthesis integral membrane protein MurJ [Aquisalimonas lutea]MDN3517449.1 murein biosynthesis integral membrane protein MurJ [Aquisalimonas lutea]